MAKITAVNDSSAFSSFLHVLRDDLNLSPKDLDQENVINAVLHWLSWSPVGLKLTFSNSKLIFFVAAMWINFLGSSTLSQIQIPLNRERHLQQLGSLLATSGKPSFWNQIETSTQSEPIRKFSIQVRKVLSGEIPQQKISDLKGI
ncbi:MAG: hypothetical protein JSU57_03305 [Candidatus Heimdallarchaeota archaeon]|nr:MAG: hypothetical protein JSU57_03305 [Candidatus Heimdallarchaeota archaeon]